MDIKLLYYTPLWVASTAIRKCWASEGNSDTFWACENCGEPLIEEIDNCEQGCTANYERTAGTKDKELIYRIGNKFKHASTLEHLNYNFDIDGISRACLQELARHRHTSLSVKSSRYTLKELKDGDQSIIKDLLVKTGNATVDEYSWQALKQVQNSLKTNVSNDLAKYCLPEAYKTSLVWTINARSLQNFLSLRTDKAALWEIRELANAIYKHLPEDHKYLFTEFVKAK